MTGTVERHDWTDETRGFVVSTFAASYRKASGITNNGAFRKLVEVFEGVIGAPGLTVLVLDGSPDEFVGWCVIHGDALVYVYVKQAYRRRYFAKGMLPDGLTRVVFQTPAGVGLQRNRYGRPLKPAPYLLMEAAA